MKAEINLLPPEFQATRHAQLYWQGLEHIMRRVIVGLVLVGAMFGGTYAVFRVIAADTNVQQQSTSITDDLVQKVTQANELLTAIDSRQLVSVPWTPLVGEVLRVLPSELTLISVAVSDTSKTLTLTGVSRSRAAVVTFEQAVKALPAVSSVESPLQNFATGGDTSFTLLVKRHEKP